jgi:cell division protein FtsI (penicillin-binding protein 3)
MTRPPLRRLVILLVVMSLGLAGIVGRLAYLQLRESGAYAELGLGQRLRTIVLPAQRGDIVDREGTPLAITLVARDVYVDPTQVLDPSGEAATIAPVLGLKEKNVREALTGSGTFEFLDRQVDLDVAQRLASLDLPGVGFIPVSKRYYPAGSVASQVLGFVGVDGAGLSGLENEYQSLLAGTPGERTIEVSAAGQPIAGGLDLTHAPAAGADLQLTIDRDLQFQAQEYLRRAVDDNGAKGGTIIVLDPHTGDVLAMASWPTFDPNRFLAASSERWRNRAVTDTWEPGSVNKVITAAAALEGGHVGVSERFDVPPVRDVLGYVLHDSHSHPVEEMTLGDIIAQSSNIGTSMVADRVGNEELASMFARFGYGQPTGVGFPGEAAGLMPALSDWTDLTRATVSFGQGVAVTPLQMAAVYATIANGGVWVQPRLVAGTRSSDGTYRPAGESTTRRVLSDETASMLARMLTFVVEDGTGENAQIAGYQVAGKTGTAKKLDDRGRYTNRYVASFIGFLPASAPRVVVAAVIDEPTTVYGGIAAAPLFQQVARYAIQRLGIAPAPAVPLPPHALPLP